MPTRPLQNQAAKPAGQSGRKSRAVPLMLAASAMLAGCGPKQARDEYLSQEDCRKDWDRPELCQPASGSGSGSHGGGRYYGPSYDAGARESAQRSVRSGGDSLGVHGVSNNSIGRSVSRGGFGGGAHVSGGG
ncbi:hypothetical protein [Paraherbaspirillum soli]|uniref:Lipoprotein n=1 Tax=Paraherbaspirillum soli TaxID=631222 RepID=A0ABW0MA31_9BURK